MSGTLTNEMNLTINDAAFLKSMKIKVEYEEPDAPRPVPVPWWVWILAIVVWAAVIPVVSTLASGFCK